MQKLDSIEAIDFHIEYVMLKMEEFAALLAFLEERRKNMILVEKGRQASAEILTEALIERMKK